MFPLYIGILCLQLEKNQSEKNDAKKMLHRVKNVVYHLPNFSREKSVCWYILIIVYEFNFVTSISVITVGQCAVGHALSRLKNFSQEPHVSHWPYQWKTYIMLLKHILFTAPTAYSEVVRVCGDCNDQLEQMQLELNKYQSSVYNSSSVQ